MVDARVITGRDGEAILPSLIATLRSTVDAGASIGFHPPLGEAEAERYWRVVLAGVERGERILIGAFLGGVLVGTVQLAREPRPNGRHRAEVQKLMVISEHRRSGIGSSLMAAAERAALEAGHTLLLLDTREGDSADHLYRRLGWSELGRVPGYTRDATGAPEGTVFFFRNLDELQPG
jgi:acetyltransferase